MPPPGPASLSDPRRAALTLVTSSLLFGMMAVAARVVSTEIPGPQIALVRFAVGVAAVIAALAIGRANLRPTRWGWLLLRGVAGGLAVYAYFSCIEHVGVGVATLLNYTAPVWALLLGWWLLAERPTGQALAALGLTLAGMVLVVGGRLAAVRDAWVLAGVFSAIASGIAVTSIRAVRRPSTDGVATESSWTVFASFTGIGLLITIPGVAGRWVSPSAGQWLVLVSVGVLSVGAQMLMTQALEHVTGATMGIIHQLTVVFSMACGVLFFDERLTGAALLGASLTFAGVAWTVLTQARAVPAPSE